MKAAVILAAGRGTRMKSAGAKVLQTLGGRSLLQWVMGAAGPLVDRLIVVVGHDRDAVRSALAGSSARTVVQEPQLGTGHAVGRALPELAGVDTFLVLAGDAPLVRREALTSLLDEHEARGAAATVMTFDAADPAGYGRIVRDAAGTVSGIVEHVDASPAELLIKECNSGTLAFQSEVVLPLLEDLPRSSKGEYYLTDVVGMLRERGLIVAGCKVKESDAQGINTPEQLADVESAWAARRLEELSAQGVTLHGPTTLLVEADVCVASGVHLGPGVSLHGRTRIGPACVLTGEVVLHDVVLGEGCVLRGPLELRDQTLPDGTQLGA